MTITATTPSAPAPVTHEGRRTKRGPQGLTWLTLRLHRWAAVCWTLLVLVAAGALLWANGPGGDAAWTEYNRMGCHDGIPNLGCDLNGPAFDRYDTTVMLVSALITLAPLSVALWAGAALIGRELENGTAQLAWTQSVSPARWLAAKLAVPAGLLTAGTLLLVLLHRSMWAAHHAQWRQLGTWQWYQREIFVANGPVAVAHVLLALAVGALIGLLTRRSLPSLGFGFFAMGSLLYALEELRPYLWPAETATTTREEGTPPSVDMAFDGGVVTADGAHISTGSCADPDCGRTDVVGYYLDHHPSSHFWPLQLVETGIVLAVTALLVLAAFRLLRRRTEGTSSTRTEGTSSTRTGGTA
ncbi:ABC transporter permease [Streptomyces europaeiscabiei]|uniref:ABC transporter permease n=1 Tax=Streptomyces europaeiscabiei TaxID=146819 RepID=UPI0029AD8F61|nr:ABC transporter permease [Streptomyces europaeiscabiei]MDX2774653.1 ABC transporter permease [Streptomyces europaeiscabiei]